jgi:acyl-CoA thioesterase
MSELGSRHDGASSTQAPLPLANTELRECGQHRYQADLPEDWTALQGVHGGFVASLAARATLRAMNDTERTLRAATFGFTRGVRPGLVDFVITPVRIGRALATYHVEVLQGGGAPSIVGRLHLSPPWEGASFSDLKPPAPDPPVNAQPLAIAGGRGHLAHLPTLVHPATTLFAGAEQARWLAWTRPTKPDVVNGEWLTMLGDYFPPAVAVRSTGPTRAVTIEYGIQIHTSSDPYPLDERRYLACEMHATHAAAGFAVEDGSIWAPDGALLATVRQTRLAG